MKRIRKLWGNEYYQGGVFLTISSLVINLLNYFFNIFAARSLGPSGFGEIVALGSYISIFSVPTLLLNTIIIRKIGESAEKKLVVSKQLEDFFISKLKKRWYMLGLVVVLIPFVPTLTNMSSLAGYMLIPLVLLLLMSTFYSAALQGLRLFFIVSCIAVIAACLKFLGAFISLVMSSNQLNMIVVFLIISGCVSYYLTLYIFRRRTAHVTYEKNIIQKRLLHVLYKKEIIITGVSVLCMTLFSNLDIILVKRLFTAQESGLYGSWTLFAKIVLYAIGPLITVSFVFFSGEQATARMKTAFWWALALLTILGCMIFFFYITFATSIIHILFGNRYDAVIPYLGQAGIFGALYTLITFLNNYFLARNNPAALILPYSYAFYIVIFFLIPKTIGHVISLNIYFSIAVVVLYLFAYVRAMIYNGVNGT